jgi:hypothetical protein
MLETFTIDTFAPHLEEAFAVRLADQALPTLTLLAATALPEHPPREGQPARRGPFSLIFRGPRAPILPQRTYRLDHPAIGAFDLFLVPVGPDQAGMCYEAVFN